MKFSIQKYLLLCTLAISSLQLYANASWERPSLIKMPSFDKEAMLREDSINEQNKGGSIRFAKQFEVNLNLQNSGEIKALPNNRNLWMLTIVSDEAYSLNIIFSKFHLIDSDTLYVYNSDKSHIIGPLTKKSNLASGILPLAPISGDTLVLELRYSQASDARKFQLESVNHDYRGFLRDLPLPIGSTKDNCSDHPSCLPELAEIKQSVCLLIINGIDGCSGTLINNTNQDGKPYLLTAAHCLGNNTNFNNASVMASSVVAFLNYEAPNCNPNIRGSMEFTIGGSTLRAFAADIDFALLELSSIPPADFRPYYAGWDVTTSPQTPFKGIHHPYFTVKRVTTENNSLKATSYPNNNEGIGRSFHWLIEEWEVGTTQGGSSGSGLFDSSLRLVGALSGGTSECESPFYDYYYRLDKAWNHYSDDSKQLKAWLDPKNSGVQSLDGFNPYGNDSALRISNILLNEEVEKAYLPAPASGLATGQNSLGITEYAEKFTTDKKGYLHGVYLMPTKANASRQGQIKIRVYNETNLSAESNPTAEVSISIKTLQWNTTNGFYETSKSAFTNNENYVRFENPIPVGESFFVSYIVPYGNSADSFAIYSAKDKIEETAFAKKDNVWNGLSAYTSRPTSLWIDPVLSRSLNSDTTQHPKNSNISVYPNPSKDKLYVSKGNIDAHEFTFQLLDYTGRKVLSKKETNVFYDSPMEIDVKSLQTGFYILSVQYHNRIESYKVIIQD